MEMMKERFAKLLLGEDMSGSGKGVCTALAVSNAITNLCGQNSLLSLTGPDFDTRSSLLVTCCSSARSHDLRPAVEAGAARAGEEGHVAAGDGVAALRQRPHRRARPLLAVVPRRSQARGTTKPTYISTVALGSRAEKVQTVDQMSSPVRRMYISLFNTAHSTGTVYNVDFSCTWATRNRHLRTDLATMRPI
jgi:hypothetical protein